MKKLILLFIALTAIFLSCKKPKIYSNNNLDFSSDTIIFDTVFTTIGSTTKSLKIYNNNTLPLNISNVELMGGKDSPFRINLDGVSGLSHSNREIRGSDSLFLFVDVRLSTNDNNLPMVIEDSIRFTVNGENQFVKLVVWGQDAYFHVNTIVSDNEPWLNDKPHVVYGVAAVGFPENNGSPEVTDLTLTIPAGTNIYFHKSSFLFVYKSTLNVQGEIGEEVVFKHDRLEPFYDDKAGQWSGIILSQAKESRIEYAIIRNAEIGLSIDTTASNNTLTIKNSIIDNSAFFNFRLNAGPKVEAENCIFGDAGVISVYLFAGGEASFKHCNFVNYWKGSRGGPAFAIKNWWEFKGQIFSRDVINTTFENCVMSGNQLTEFVIDTLSNSTSLFEATFSNCLLYREDPYTYQNFSQIIWNSDPLFSNLDVKNFKFDIGSPLNNAGLGGLNVMIDIEGNVRNQNSPDIGSYEN